MIVVVIFKTLIAVKINAVPLLHVLIAHKIKNVHTTQQVKG